MDILKTLAHGAAALAAVALIFFGRALHARAQPEELGFVSFPKENAASAGFSGMAKLETWYEPLIVGYPEVGEPWDGVLEMNIAASARMRSDAAVSGIVRNESNYAYVTTRTSSGSYVLPIHLVDNGAPTSDIILTPEPALPSTSRKSYGGVLGHPTRDLALYANSSDSSIDAFALSEEGEKFPMEFVERFDFPELDRFSTVTASDDTGGFGYFATSMDGGLAVMKFTAAGFSKVGVFYCANGAWGIGGMAVDSADGRLYITTRTRRIQVYDRPTTPALPVFLFESELPTDIDVLPKHIAVDSANRVLYVSSAPEGIIEKSFRIAKFGIGNESLTPISGWGTSLPGGDILLLDSEHGQLYTSGLKRGFPHLFRIDVGAPMDPPRYHDDSTSSLYLPDIFSEAPLVFGSLRDANARAYFFSNGSGHSSRVLKANLNPNPALPGSMRGMELYYSSAHFPVPYTRVDSVNLYTHGGGGKVRIGLYGQHPTIADSLLWESPEVDSVENGWVSVPIAMGSRDVVELPPERRVWIAFTADSASVRPSLLGNDGYAHSALSPTGRFTSPVSGYQSRSEKFSVYFTHQEAAVAHIRLVPSLEGFSEEYTRDRRFYLDFSESRGQPSEIHISTDPDFATSQTLSAYSTRILLEFTPEQQIGHTIHIYSKIRNGFSESPVVTDSITLDENAPARPPAPAPVTPVSFDGMARFAIQVPVEVGYGSPIHQLEVELGTTPNGNDIATQFYHSDRTFSVAIPPGATVYARVRAYDQAGNIGEWSPSSPGVYLNLVPEVRSLSINRPVPVTTDDVVSSFTLFDANGDDVQPEVEWVLNGEVMSTTHTLSAAQTLRDEEWKLRVRGQDEYLQYGPWEEVLFTIRNSLPTLPFVKIVPTTPQPDEDIVADVQTYSTDGDGDEIGYQFKWFKSTDGGATFIEKLELRDSAQVNRNYLNAGELWEVHYIPYEVPPAGSTAPPIEGFPAKDRVYIGENQLPEFTLYQPFGKTLASRDVFKDFLLNVYWDFNEPEDEACTVSLYWTDKLESGLVPVALDLPAKDYGFIGEIEIPSDRPIYLHGIITDEKGAIVQRTTSAIREGELGHGVVAY